MKGTTMDIQARSAFIIAQAACATAEVAAMQASNTAAIQANSPPPFSHDDFISIQSKYHIGWNDVISYLRDG